MDEKTMWIVVRRGVYMQGIVGVYSTNQKAQEALTEAKKLEPDKYHTFEINNVKIDAPAWSDGIK